MCFPSLSFPSHITLSLQSYVHHSHPHLSSSLLHLSHICFSYISPCILRFLLSLPYISHPSLPYISFSYSSLISPIHYHLSHPFQRLISPIHPSPTSLLSLPYISVISPIHLSHRALPPIYQSILCHTSLPYRFVIH